MPSEEEELFPQKLKIKLRTNNSASSSLPSLISDGALSSTSHSNNSQSTVIECDPNFYTEKSINFDPLNFKRVYKKDCCYFCKCLVGNFARHLQRKHSNELEVQEFLSKDPNSKQRKAMITLLRNKGNSFINTPDKCIKPVKRPNLLQSPDNFVQCTYCYGYYVQKTVIVA